MKRIIILILSVLMLISLFAACAEESKDIDDTSSKTESAIDTSDEKSETTPSENSDEISDENSDETSSASPADTSSESPDESVDTPSAPDEPDTPDTPDEPVEYDPTPRDLEYAAYFFDSTFSEGLVSKELGSVYKIIYGSRYGEIKPYVINNKSELKKFISYLETQNGEELIGFLNGLPDDYFNNKVIIANDYTAPFTGHERMVKNIRADENGVTVYYEYAFANGGDDMMCPQMVIIEIDKSDILGCDSFNAEVEVIESAA